MQEQEELLKELEELKKKLEAAQNWMRREIESQIKLVIQNKESSITEGFEEKIAEKIHSFFTDILLIQTPDSVVENLIMSEVEYELLLQGNRIDPLSVIISYQKVLDACVEKFIIQDFRKYAKKHNCITLSENHHLEKVFHSVVNDGYILWLNKFLFSLLEISKQHISLPYISCFRDFLQRRKELWNILFSPDFLEASEKILWSDIFWGKRHSGEISLSEVESIRSIVVGKFETKSCLIYKLFETQKIDI